MSDLVKRLRVHRTKDAMDAADCIEAMEAALRKIVAGYDWCMKNHSNHIMPSMISEAIQDGRAALAPEPDK